LIIVWIILMFVRTAATTAKAHPALGPQPLCLATRTCTTGLWGTGLGKARCIQHSTAQHGTAQQAGESFWS
jgi:hypothetical protein